MNTSLDCLPCFIRQALDAVRITTNDPARQEQLLREILHLLAETDLNLPPPAVAQRLHRRLRESSGTDDPYREHKDRHNRMALRLLPGLRAQVEASDDPLMTAAHLAIAGNIIDLGAKSGLTEQEIEASIRHAAGQPLTGNAAAFRQAVTEADTILYLADNAGEIVFDRLLIEQIGPARVTVAVRGRPVINDAVLEDARAAGLDRIVPVIENGSDAPGTLPGDGSAEFLRRLETADLVISKGQGNFEGLSGCGQNIFYLFKAKCPVVAASAGVPVGTHVLRAERSGR